MKGLGIAKFVMFIRYLKSCLKKQPQILAVGDSWFNLTVFSFRWWKIDILDWLKSSGLNIIDVAIPGYRLVVEKDWKLYRNIMQRVLKKQKKLLMLISLGGNDFVWSYLKKSLSPENGGTLDEVKITGYVNNYFRNDLPEYIRMVRNDFMSFGGEKILFVIHGYDYINAHEDFFGFGGKGSMTKMFNSIGIKDDDKINQLFHRFQDIYNDAAKMMANGNVDVSYIDLRGTLDKTEFGEDIHPTPEGARKVAKSIENHIHVNIPMEFYLSIAG